MGKDEKLTGRAGSFSVGSRRDVASQKRERERKRYRERRRRTEKEKAKIQEKERQTDRAKKSLPG